MNFDKERSKFEKIKRLCVCVWREGVGAGGLTAKLYAKLCHLRSNTEIKLYAKLCHLRSNTEIQLSTQCRACSKINISKLKTLI